MTSERQIAANRLNAQKSTGPRSRNGKLRSRRNALRHGLTAETVLEGTEDPAEYRAFERAIIADFSPTSTIEHALVVRLASLLWRLKRATAMETGLLGNSPEPHHQLPIANLAAIVHVADATILANTDPTSLILKLIMSLVSARALDRIMKTTSGSDGDNGLRSALEATSSQIPVPNLESFALVLRYQTALSRQLTQTLLSIAQVREHTNLGLFVRRNRKRQSGR